MDVDIKNQLISRTAKVLMFLGKNKDSNIVQISRGLEIDYNFVSKIIRRCEEIKLLTVGTDNRQKIIQLTAIGKKLSGLLVKIEKML